MKGSITSESNLIIFRFVIYNNNTTINDKFQFLRIITRKKKQLMNKSMIKFDQFLTINTTDTIC